VRNGVIFLDSEVRMTDITDGSSNTLLLGERPPDEWREFARWHGGWGIWTRAGSSLGVRETSVEPLNSQCFNSGYRFQRGSLNDPCSIFHFWSLHPGGANFARADGSVTFMSYSAESILPALATRAGGEVVQQP
jgi:prepilin-type processing-associated H-X9-DG protein